MSLRILPKILKNSRQRRLRLKNLRLKSLRFKSRRVASLKRYYYLIFIPYELKIDEPNTKVEKRLPEEENPSEHTLHKSIKSIEEEEKDSENESTQPNNF